ncbi:unannotated protein [freshwater metagenome]|uniref:Unannotated protein n=1 Tax=freshwater metagenome TaxID=449393 RepID=A0A6J6L0Q0_9ZZZZ
MLGTKMVDASRRADAILLMTASSVPITLIWIPGSSAARRFASEISAPPTWSESVNAVSRIPLRCMGLKISGGETLGGVVVKILIAHGFLTTANTR